MSSRASSTDSSQKRAILLEFTRELIRHSSRGEVYALKNAIDRDFAEKAGRIGGRQNSLLSKKSPLMEKSLISPGEKAGNFDEAFMGKDSGTRLKAIFQRKSPRTVEYINPLVIPSAQLPPRFQYLKPTPTKADIDLGKLNPLVKDPMVGEIECQGANQKIIVSGTMGRKKTGISLSREEIEGVIGKFSEEAKIPVQEGVFNVAAGNFVFSAIVSNLITSRFIIKKINYNPDFRRR